MQKLQEYRQYQEQKLGEKEKNLMLLSKKKGAVVGGGSDD